MSKLPLVTFGFVNCNRLFYLKSCVESLLVCTEDYPNKELIIIDNASAESGTKEYLDNLSSRGFTVVRNKKRDPSNEYAKGINTIIELANGEYICPLAGDMQFILKGGWLKEYVRINESLNDFIGSISFDAQRRVTIERSLFGNAVNVDSSEFNFVFDYSRPPFAPSCNSFFHRSKLKYIGSWSENSISHEGSSSAEYLIQEKVKKLKNDGIIFWSQLLPIYPVSVAIYTDQRGTMGRVRGNKRFGDYWEAKRDNLYYETTSYEEAIKFKNERKPVPIEKIAKGIGWEVPIDKNGSWKKNPIRPEDCRPEDFVEID